MIEEKEAAQVEEAAKALAGYVSETGRSVRVFARPHRSAKSCIPP